jgi:hypothetical protein
MARVLVRSHVERAPVPPEASYLGELFRAAQQALLDALFRGSRMFKLPRSVLEWTAAGLAVLAAILLLRLLLPRMRRAKKEAEISAAVVSAAPAYRDAAAWRAALERYLAEGRTAEALEALWWWLARSVAGERAEPDWTSRELVTRARREDLRELVRRLDAFTYGPRPPATDDLRRLMGRLEEVVA